MIRPVRESGRQSELGCAIILFGPGQQISKEEFMQFITQATGLKNLVVVTANLQVESVSLDLLRKMPGVEPSQARVISAPDQIVAIYPEIEMICEIQPRRLIVTDQSSTTIEGETITNKISHLVSNIKPTIVAYGFNFEAIIQVQDTQDSGEYLRNSLLANYSDREAALAAKILSMQATLKYQRGDVKYELTLRPEEEIPGNAHARLNVHYTTTSLPSRDLLHQQMMAGLKQLTDDLGSL